MKPLSTIQKAAAWRLASNLLEDAALGQLSITVPALARHIQAVIVPSLRRRSQIISRRKRRAT